ncbi:rifin PIR protein, putative [Plasmodium reichenowi]|uniref:Rifin PIR protein, putative n=1 Tax=Plasmodium reichenowi TaxID=5854 RepID=A0A2P9D3X5_PLARE|nr:rifin PIR protein, putative [Plasmodium reichenowi]
MKQHYSNILLFAFLLNILVTSYHAHNNNNEPYITPRHTLIYTSRVLGESDIQSSNYDKDGDMKSVQEIFDQRTSQRFHEYDERLQDKRQKRKDERDKNIQQIIEKDKMEKSLAQKVEKGCLKCGCGLGGVAAGVGIFGAVSVNELTKAAMTAALASAEKAGAIAGKIVGDAKGMEIVILGLETLKADKLIPGTYKSFVATNHYTDVTGLVDIIDKNLSATCWASSSVNESICGLREKLGVIAQTGKEMVPQKAAIRRVLDQALQKATQSAKAAAEAATDEAKAAAIETNTGVVEAASSQLYSAIGYSVLAILIIVLIMVIIYLVLRYRRKKKMKKKAQYTKLLNQ